MKNDLKKQKLFPKNFDFNVITNSAITAIEAIQLYNKKDIEATIFMMKRLYKKLAPKKRHISQFRTNSSRKWAGHKNNKPKYNWGKKRKAQMKVSY